MRTQYLKCPVAFNDDLYAISHQSLFVIKQGQMYRLCDFHSEVRDLRICGSTLSFFSREHSNGDIYTYEIGSSEINRITYFDDAGLRNVSLSENHATVASSVRSAFRSGLYLYEIGLSDKKAQKLPYVHGTYLAKSKKHTVFQRFGYGYHAWRGYKGGAAAKLYLVHKGNNDAELLPFTDNNAHTPIFVGERLFFISDIDYNPNIYEYDLEAKKYTQVTFHDDFCVRDISAWGDDKILYSCGGKIWCYKINSGKSEEITVQSFDYSYTDSPFTLNNPIEYLTSASINEKGDHISISARGHTFFASINDKAFVKSSENIRYRSSCFLSNTKLLQVKDNGNTAIFETYDLEQNQVVSSVEVAVGNVREIEVIDENRVVVENHKALLFIVDLAKKTATKILEPKFWELAGFDVSPDKKWIAYSAICDISARHTSNMNAIYLYNIELNEHYKVTKGMSEMSPSFSQDGKYIYFLSDFNLKSKWDGYYFNMYFAPNTVVCALCLNKDVPHPFKPRENIEIQEEKSGENDKPAEKTTEIMVNEISCVKSDIPAGKYTGLISVGPGKLLLFTSEDDGKTSLNLADTASHSVTNLFVALERFGLSQNREWMIVSNNEKLRIGKSTEPFDDNEKPPKEGGWIGLNNLNININPRAEWENIMFEVWWMTKQYFWHKDFNNLDWDAVLNKYQGILPNARSREDLNLIIEELIGENRTSHNYIYDRGDNERVQHQAQGYLGARCVWKNGGYEVVEIERCDEFEGFRLTPLTEPGSMMRVGDIIVEIDGERCRSEIPIEALLRNKGNKNIVVTYVRDEQRVRATIKPLASLGALRYRQWVDANREYVRKVTQNRIGYIHIPDMDRRGFTEFHKYYNQARLYDGMIVDVRYNGGGNVSPLLISTLRNFQYGFSVMQDQFEEYPHYSHKGNLVGLCNEVCGSDGDIFTHAFKKYGLGEMIGKRTWGGVVGIDTSGRYRFIDGGFVVYPAYGMAMNEAGVDIENRGVEPDIEIDNHPVSMTELPEHDLQLAKAIEVILAKTKSDDLEQTIRRAIYKS